MAIGRIDHVIGDRGGRVIARDGYVVLASERQVGVLPLPLPSAEPYFLAQWPSPGNGADL